VTTVIAILIVSTLNLGLGYALALYLHQPTLGVRSPRGRRSSRTAAVPNEPATRNAEPNAEPPTTQPVAGPKNKTNTESADTESIATETAQTADTGTTDTEAETENASPASLDMPIQTNESNLTDEPGEPAEDDTPEPPAPQWMEWIAAATEPETRLITAAKILRLEASEHRKVLVELDACLRGDTLESDRLDGFRARLHDANQRYLAHQKILASSLAEHQASWGEWAEPATDVEATLSGETARFEAADGELETLDFSADASSGGARLLSMIAKLFDAHHRLRDGIEPLLTPLIAGEPVDSDEAAEPNLRLDETTGLKNRAGLEQVLCQWWQDDPNRVRQLSVVLLDVDRFGTINERFGVPAGDRMLVAIAKVVAGLLRKNRGFDVAARFDGQRLLLVLGDTGPHGATSAAERARQAVEAADFELREERITVTLSCGVTDVRHDDTSKTLFDRAMKTVRACKPDGGNRTLLDEGNGPEEVEPPQYNVESHCITLND